MMPCTVSGSGSSLRAGAALEPDQSIRTYSSA